MLKPPCRPFLTISATSTRHITY